MKNLTRIQNLRRFLETNGNQIFSVTYLNKQGNVTKTTGRLHVKTSERETTVSHKPEYITVYDMHKRGFRNVNMETVYSVRQQNTEYAL